MHAATKTLLGVTAIGAACVAYGAGYEVRSFRLRRRDVPVLPNGQPPLRILHLSDLHVTPKQAKKKAWVASLRALEPDAVIVTGDFLADVDAVPHALAALEPLMELPGAFVLGSNDYYAPRPLNPARYLAGPSGLEPNREMLDWGSLVNGLTDAGWIDLSNARGELKADGRLIELRGVDDPHIGRDRYESVSGAYREEADLTLGVTHAPYLRVLDGFAADNTDVILAGHTHGGQLCIPGLPALVTNCDIDRKRAKGLHHHENSWLHVSAGLGTSPYAPIRFACPPEATLLTLR